MFGGGIAPEALTVSVVTAGQAGATQSAVIVGHLAMGKVGVGNGQGGAIAIYQFADGQRYNHVDFLGNFAATPVGQVTSLSGQTQHLGGRNDDTLAASDRGAFIAGGRGNDMLSGSGGNNTYLYNVGGGIDHIADTSPKQDAGGTPLLNTLKFGSGIAAADIVLSLHGNSLKLAFAGRAGDAVFIDGANPGNDGRWQRAA